MDEHSITFAPENWQDNGNPIPEKSGVFLIVSGVSGGKNGFRASHARLANPAEVLEHARIALEQYQKYLGLKRSYENAPVAYYKIAFCHDPAPIEPSATVHVALT